VVNWSKPTWYITYNNVSVTNNDYATTINNLYRYVLNLQFNNSSQGPQQIQQANCCDMTYIAGATHDTLVGSGVFDTAPILGLLIQVTARPSPTRALEGTPPYLWNMGWISLSNSDGMLAEHRITRDTTVWFPTGASLGQTVGYYTYPGVTLKVTELVRPTVLT
jgi:hypothetical protein